MTLLEGLNYDFSGQERTFILEPVGKGNTTLKVDNTAGLANNDYLVINPGSEISEIVKIGATVAANTVLTISATKFNHSTKEKVYRLPYN